MRSIKLFEMFSGFGGASFALKKAGIDFECVGYSEIDKYAIQCFNQNFPNVKNFGDCTKINPNDLSDFDLLTGGFPCQSFSIAGKGLGELDTRGTLFYEIIRIAEVKKPNFMLLENVKGLTNKPHKKTFKKILSELDRIGYDVKWKVLNSKEYGIPQNRQRVFFVCFRKGIDINFSFPEKEELKIFLKDILEKEVDEKYYLSEEQTKRLSLTGWNQKEYSNSIRLGGRQSLDKKHTWDIVKVGNVNPSGRGMNGKVYLGEVSPTITTNKGEGAKIIQLNNPTHSNNRIYLDKGVSLSLNTRGGGNRQPFIISSTQKHNSINNKGIMNCLPEAMGKGGGHTPMIMNTITEAFGRGRSSSEHIQMVKKTSLACGLIRKLTPTECFRLMGFLNDEINLNGLSNTQKYKLAGNGFEINLVSKIFKKMFK